MFPFRIIFEIADYLPESSSWMESQTVSIECKHDLWLIRNSSHHVRSLSLQKIIQADQKFASVKKLELKTVFLSDLDDFFAQFSQLRFFSLVDCEWNALHNEELFKLGQSLIVALFRYCPHTERLDISNSKIGQISRNFCPFTSVLFSNIYHRPELTWLNLDSNQFTVK